MSQLPDNSQTEIEHLRSELQKAHQELRKLNQELDLRVWNRTTKLRDANDLLASEVDERRRLADELAYERDKLQASNHRITEILSSIAEGYTALDRDYRIVAANEIAEQMHGLPRDRMVGHYLWDIFPNVRETEFFRQYHIAFTENHPVHFEAYTAQENKWYEVHAYPRPAGLDIYFHDITARRRADNEIKQLYHDIEERAAEVEAERLRWKGMVEGIADEVWICDVEGRMSLINVPRVTEMGLEEFENKTVQQVYDEVDILNLDGQMRPLEEAPLLRALRSGSSVRGEEIMRHKRTGRVRYRHYSAAPTRDTTGAITGAVAIVRDTTHEKQAEDALRETVQTLEEREEVLRLALEGGQAGAWSWDLQTNTLHWSDEYYRLFGFEPGSLEPSAEAGFGRVHPEDRPAAEARVRDAIEHGTSIDLIHRVLLPDGSIRWVRGLARVFRLEDGRPARMAGIALDITESKEREQALRESEERFRMVLENSLDAAYRRDLRTDRYDYLSPVITSLTGFTVGEFSALAYEDVMARIHHDDIGFVRREVARTLGDESTAAVEYRLLGKDGKYVWVADNFRVLKDEAGRPHYRVGIFRDVTASKLAEREIQRLYADLEQRATQLEISNHELESFSYSVSHDLRAPLAAIANFSGLLQQECGASLAPAAQRYLGLVQENAAAMSNLVEALLRLSRLSRQPISKQSVDMTELVSQVIEAIKQELGERQVEFTIQEMPNVRGDPVLLKQVWSNLIANAVKFTRHTEHAHIQIGCRRCEDADQAFFVCDNGIGFNMDLSDKLFGVFQRLHPDGEFEGSGVGLAIVERIVRRHGGHVWAEAEEGKGATFYFALGG